jgi:LysM repeat protein
MKISKVFGFVLCLHLGVIAVLIVQPGCRTTQPPTQTYQQNSTIGVKVQKSPVGLIPATRVDAPIDPAFNAGFETSAAGRYAPTRPADEVPQLDPVAPQLEPIPSAPIAPTVDVAGPSFESYSVKKGDSLWAIAKRNNVSLSELYTANGLSQNSVLKIGQQIQIPVEGGTAAVKTETADAYQPSGYTVLSEDYTVQAGDNLSKIASKFDTSVSALKAANNKTSNVIRVGEKLIVPVGAATVNGVSVAPKGTAQQSVAAASIRMGRTHTVKAGEYPGTIARQYGMTTAELLAVNGITDPRKIQIGQKLRVSSTGSAANVDSKVETVKTVKTSAAQPAVVAAPSVTSSNNAPVAIRIVEADPLVESEAREVTSEATEVDGDALFENVVEIPVIRMEDK